MEQGTRPAEAGRALSPNIQSSRDAVTAALARLESGQRDALEELRVALCDYVGTLGREGWTRDEVLAHVRELTAAPVTPGGAVALMPIVREALAELTLEWCRTEYARFSES